MKILPQLPLCHLDRDYQSFRCHVLRFYFLEKTTRKKCIWKLVGKELVDSYSSIPLFLVHGCISKLRPPSKLIKDKTHPTQLSFRVRHEWIIKCCSSPTKEHHLPPYVFFVFEVKQWTHKQPQEGGNSQPTPAARQARTILQHLSEAWRCWKANIPWKVPRKILLLWEGLGWNHRGPQMSNGERKKIGGTGGGGSSYFWGSLKFFFGLGGFERLWLGDFWGARVGGTIGQRFVKIHEPFLWIQNIRHFLAVGTVRFVHQPVGCTIVFFQETQI